MNDATRLMVRLSSSEETWEAAPPSVAAKAADAMRRELARHDLGVAQAKMQRVQAEVATLVGEHGLCPCQGISEGPWRRG